MTDCSPEKTTILLLCSRMALPDGARPFTAKEFSALLSDLNGGIRAFSGLIGKKSSEVARQLQVSGETAERIAVLLDPSRELNEELESLASNGIWVLTRGEDAYPRRFTNRLGKTSPWVLFGAGKTSLLNQGGIAVVGSRNVNEDGNALAQFLGKGAAACDMLLCSGAARGVDQVSMRSAIAEGGKALGVLADSLTRTIRQAETRELLEDGRLTLLTPFSPDAPFSVGTAMGRNKLIYCIADYGFVVASDAERGGTWAGATEALKEEWVPVLVGEYPSAPEGNSRLILKGGLPFPHPFGREPSELVSWVETATAGRSVKGNQRELF